MGRSNLFNRGYDVARKEAKRIEKDREKRKGQLWRLFLKEDEEREIYFLTEEPVTFYEHSIPNKGKYDNVPCTGEDCPHCDNGNPSFKGAYLVWDNTPYKDSNGKKQKGSLRLYVAGTKVVTQLDRLHTKYGLTKFEYTIIRMGSGTATTYSFERGEQLKLSKRDIESMLPENFAKLYDGTAESLYTIVEKAIEASITDNKPSKKKSSRYDDDDYDDYDDDEYSDDYDEEYDDEYDDEEDDNDYVDDDDEEDEDDYEEPRRKSSTSLKKKKPSSNVKAKSSAKSLFNKNRRR